MNQQNIEDPAFGFFKEYKQVDVYVLEEDSKEEEEDNQSEVIQTHSSTPQKFCNTLMDTKVPAITEQKDKLKKQLQELHNLQNLTEAQSRV